MPPEVKVRLSVEGTPEALAAFRSVQAQSHQSAQSMQADFGDLKSVMGGVVGIAGALGVATTAVATFQQAVSLLRDSYDLAEQLGSKAQTFHTPTSTLVATALEAKQTNIEFEDLTTRMGRLAPKLTELQEQEPGMVRLFASIGLGARDLKGQDLGAHFLTVLQAVGRLEDGYRKIAIMQTLFGRGGEELIPLADKLAREGFDPLTQKIAALFSEKNVGQVESLKRQLAELDMTVKGIALDLPAEAFTGLDRDVSGIAAAILDLAEATKQMSQAVPLAPMLVSGSTKLIVGLVRLGAEEIRHFVEVTRLDVRQLVDELDAIRKGRLDQLENIRTGYGVEQAKEDEQHRRVTDALMRNPLPAASVPGVAPGAAAGEPRALPALGARAGVAAPGSEFDREQQAYKLLLETWEKKDKALYEQGLLSLRQYFSDRSDIIDLEMFNEIDLIQRERDRIAKLPLTSPAAAAAREKDFETRYTNLQLESQQLATRTDLTDAQRAAGQADVNARIAALTKERAEFASRETITAEQRARRLKELDDQETEARRRAGRDREALHGEEVTEEQQLETKRLGFEKDLAKEQRTEHEQRLEEIREQRREYEKVLTQGMGQPGFPTTPAGVTAAADIWERGRVSVEVFNDQLERAEALKKQFLEKGYVTPEEEIQLQTLADNLTAIAGGLGPKQAGEAKDFGASLEHARQETTFWADETDALRGGWASFFSQGISGFKSLLDFGRQFLTMIAQITVQVAATRWANAIFGAPQTHAAGGRIERRAWGGQIFGPGTWTSDSVPILASRDEHVIRAAVASARGVRPYLERLNAADPSAIAHARAFDGGEIRLNRDGGALTRHFAAGGRVAALPTSFEHGGTLTLELPDGMTLAPGSKVSVRGPGQDEQFLGLLVKHRRAVRRILN